MNSVSTSKFATSRKELERKLQDELSHYKHQLKGLNGRNQSEHDRWYRGTLEKLVDRRSRMLDILFPAQHGGLHHP